MIFYFTATGNSLYIARNLDDKVISIPQVIHLSELKFKDEKIGIVCPVYAAEPPKMVLEFLRKAEFKTDYLYMILTYGKNARDACEYMAALAQEMGHHFNYIHSILMVDNYVPAFDMEQEKQLDKNVQTQLESIRMDIMKKRNDIQKAVKEYRDFHQNKNSDPSLMNGQQIMITDRCVGCGVCTRVCPIGNLTLQEGKSMRQSQICEYCMACLHHCPFKAISINHSDINPKARYRHEQISLSDIMQSNNQNK